MIAMWLACVTTATVLFSEKGIKKDLLSGNKGCAEKKKRAMGNEMAKHL